MRDRREILVCLADLNHHGYRTISLYTEDLLKPFFNAGEAPPETGSHPKFFVLRDNSDCCDTALDGSPFAGDGVSWGDVEKVEFGKNTAAGPPRISVTASFGKGVWTAEAIKTREQGGGADVLPPPKHYHIDFIWDGHDYKATLASAAAGKIFAE